MNSPPEAATLSDLQGRFAAALREPGPQSEVAIRLLAECIVDDGLAPARRLQVYRNNARAMFEGALERTYPVLRRQVGDERFAALARRYRAEHPSRSGDLHWVGEKFAPWLAARVAADGGEWLAELARLEWACEEAMVSARLPPLAPADLGRWRRGPGRGRSRAAALRAHRQLPVPRVVGMACRPGRWYWRTS